MEEPRDEGYEVALILATMLVYKLRDPNPTHDTVTDAYDDFADYGWAALFSPGTEGLRDYRGPDDDVQSEVEKLWDLAHRALAEIDARCAACSAATVEASKPTLAGVGD